MNIATIEDQEKELIDMIVNERVNTQDEKEDFDFLVQAVGNAMLQSGENITHVKDVLVVLEDKYNVDLMSHFG